MNERQEGLGEIVVAGGNASELLDTVEEAFDQMAALVDMSVERTGGEAMGSRRDDSLTALFRYRRHEGIRVVALVGHDKPGDLILDQSAGLVDVGNLTRREDDAQRIAQGIYRDMQLGRQPAPRSTDFLTAGFFWAPDECWCARTMVESMKRCSMSASPCMAVAIRSQTPLSRQREK
jgi:hypothetical protein